MKGPGTDTNVTDIFNSAPSQILYVWLVKLLSAKRGVPIEGKKWLCNKVVNCKWNKIYSNVIETKCIYNNETVRTSSYQEQLTIKLKTIHKSLFSVPIKGRSQCHASFLHCSGYGHLRRGTFTKLYRDRSLVVEFLLQLENNQLIMPKAVEIQHLRNSSNQ